MNKMNKSQKTLSNKDYRKMYDIFDTKFPGAICFKQYLYLAKCSFSTSGNYKSSNRRYFDEEETGFIADNMLLGLSLESILSNFRQEFPNSDIELKHITNKTKHMRRNAMQETTANE